MELIRIYQCMCDVTRLRLLNLLTRGPLCVCHFQSVLREPQVKVSKHLAYLRARKLVQTRRSGSWIIYSLPAKPSRELTANLACLQEYARDERIFQRDLAQLAKNAGDIAATGPCACAE